MSIYNLNLSIGTIAYVTRAFIDIAIIWFVIYYALKIVNNSTRTQQYFKGIIIIVTIDLLAKFFRLETVSFVTSLFLNWGFLALIIIFQPEIRHLLENLGTSAFFSKLVPLSGNEKENLVDAIVDATITLSNNQTGALICIEQNYSLSDYTKNGTPLNSVVTHELLASIFIKNAPLHDGAVIIQGDRITCACAYLPSTNQELPSKYGARHRAAVGISETTDCVTVVVSEETGNICITQNGKIIPIMSRKELRNYLMRVICGEEIEINTTPRRNTPETGIKFPKNPQVKANDRMENTSVLSKLAIKKQGEATSNEPVIQAESVVVNNAEVVQVPKKETSKMNQTRSDSKKAPPAKSEPKKSLFGRKEKPVKEEPKVEAPPVEVPVAQPDVQPEVQPVAQPVKQEVKTPTYIPNQKQVSVMGFEPVIKPMEQSVSKPVKPVQQAPQETPKETTPAFDVDKIFSSTNSVNHKFDMVDNISMSTKSDASNKGRGNH